MPSHPPANVVVQDSETYQTLLARAHRRTGGVPPESLVRHAIAVARDGDWPVQREALEAILRRCASAQADDIRLVDRPRGGLLGLYATRRRGSRAHPYRTLLRGVDPIDGSCNCPDFLRNSLGLCKHLVAVLEYVQSKARGRIDREPAPEPPPLAWDPVRPLTGPGDWLARVRWLHGAPAEDVRRFLRRAGKSGWSIVAPDAAPQRLTLVKRLAHALGNGDREPALHASLQEERARLERAMEARVIGQGLARALRTLKLTLYPYQREGVERFLTRGRLLLADDMGLGKTAQAIAACHALWQAGRIRRGLIIVPAALKPQWLREWQTFTDAPAALI